MTEREELARVIDPSSWLVLDSYLAEVKRKHPNSGYDPDNFKDRESLTKADQWLSRPSPVDGVVEALRAIATEPDDDDHGPEQGPAFLWEWAQARARLAIAAYDKANGETK